MSLVEVFQFSIYSGLGGVGTIYGLVSAVGCGLLLWFLRYSINKKWSGGFKLLLVPSLLCGLVVACWFGLKEAPEHIEGEKRKLQSFLEPAPEWRADALARAWNELSRDGGQAGLTSPEEGGVQISLRNSAEAEIYTGIIADVVAEEIQAIASSALLVDFSSKEDVTATVFDMNQVAAMDYAVTLDQGNMFESLVLEHRLAEYAKDYNSEVADGTPRVTPILLIVAIASIVLFGGLIMRGAWVDLMSFA